MSSYDAVRKPEAPDLGDRQRQHWQSTYDANPEMYGQEPAETAVRAAEVFRAAGVRTVLELGAGHGRDALYLARAGFEVHATDFSETGLNQLRARARADGHAGVTIQILDVREPLPLADESTDAVYAHMLLCMALSTNQIRVLVEEIRRVLRPGGVLFYTVRHTGDAHYGAGIDHGDDIYEHGGFAVHFFSRALVEDLATGWDLQQIGEFEEGALPRRLWSITQTRR
ncbi:class I SAM-dependent methyltransferase [Nocardia vaccinii]|uniref:class I SAM-dependent methyltransferase n=1 Tax=Nocardia vaccinii TaxID=1822 RepID=UPI00082BC807|nr:class I SAM-dependent methyltransferase [Nocardia vaccinii]